MREIKFRIWHEETKRFYYLYLSEVIGLERVLSIPANSILQQYTGLRDKSGKEVFEGDLIQYNRQSSYDGVSLEAKWSSDRWGWVFVSKSGDFFANEYTPEGDRFNFIEVVGNIFENPEL